MTEPVRQDQLKWPFELLLLLDAAKAVCYLCAGDIRLANQGLHQVDQLVGVFCSAKEINQLMARMARTHDFQGHREAVCTVP